MANSFITAPYYIPIFGGYVSVQPKTDFSLSAQLVLGTSGPGIAVRFLPPPGSVHLTKVYCFLPAVSATGHNLTAYLCNYGASVSRPGTSPLTTITAAGGDDSQ